jgi:hypothetical protein
MESKFTGRDTLGEHSDKRLTCFHLETVMELPKAGVALSSFDQRRYTRRKYGFANHLS